MARALRLLVATAIAMPLLIATGGRAVACSCAPMTAKQTIHRADAIVAGHVVDQMEIDPTTTRTTFAVDGVYRGDVPAVLTLVANIGSGGGSSCALLYPPGANVDPLVLDRQHDGTYQTSPCSLLSLHDVRALLGRAKPPPPGASPSGGTIAATPGSLAGRHLSWPAVLGGVAAAVLLMTWALQRLHRERARTQDGVATLQAKARRHEDRSR